MCKFLRIFRWDSLMSLLQIKIKLSVCCLKRKRKSWWRWKKGKIKHWNIYLFFSSFRLQAKMGRISELEQDKRLYNINSESTSFQNYFLNKLIFFGFYCLLCWTEIILDTKITNIYIIIIYTKITNIYIIIIHTSFSAPATPAWKLVPAEGSSLESRIICLFGLI